MIDPAFGVHLQDVLLLPPSEVAAAPCERAAEPVAVERLRRVVEQAYAPLHRSVRRFGVPPARVDEAVSRVVDVFVRRHAEVEAGKELAFLVRTAVRVSADLRKSEARRARAEAALADVTFATGPSPEDELAAREDLALLDEVLASLQDDVRPVFVLHEIEGWALPRIAEALELPLGTATSRLRRAREQFERRAELLRRAAARGTHGVAAAAAPVERRRA